MANAPIPVDQKFPRPATPGAANAPDIWRSMRSEMDRMFDRFTGAFSDGSFRPARLFDMPTVPLPAVDITEADGAFQLTAELPGLTEKDIEISVSDDVLTITGEKRQESDRKQEDFHLTERSYGQFRRSFYLPQGVDREKIDARFSNGVLTVTMPKAPSSAATKIEVKAATA